ncbi:hypothetical protein L202_07225 [Cryptococcus amylolentus CBS 6039]|uniref:Uncharacterized protein n=2 Tax=Cryptococcus amylolentus TaxID=104669 RepID=A0A1E3HBF7_9TREE|nr:hypothetical protein L202_07225 [Cryptococcus amylolentus CBS 6039]ODN73678.1 hypothetical protein L202_07225 [Cryptococcus amylolentus CBS 6039]ODO00428.1 hypothetical protein I350_07068 [Cryptococcus amylolentus CBS 6273]
MFKSIFTLTALALLGTSLLVSAQSDASNTTDTYDHSNHTLGGETGTTRESRLADIPVYARNYTRVSQKPENDDIEHYINQFVSTCPEYQVKNLTTEVNSGLGERGDWDGNNEDTQALVYCLRTDDNDNVVDSFTEEIVSQLGGTIIG